MTRRDAEEIRRLTIGKRQYLNGPDGGPFYWSDFRDEDERDDPGGGPFFSSPVAAIASLGRSAGFLKFPGSMRSSAAAAIVARIQDPDPLAADPAVESESHNTGGQNVENARAI
jgi:hypothetical protein